MAKGQMGPDGGPGDAGSRAQRGAGECVSPEAVTLSGAGRVEQRTGRLGEAEEEQAGKPRVIKSATGERWETCPPELRLARPGWVAHTGFCEGMPPESAVAAQLLNWERFEGQGRGRGEKSG